VASLGGGVGIELAELYNHSHKSGQDWVPKNSALSDTTLFSVGSEVTWGKSEEAIQFKSSVKDCNDPKSSNDLGIDCK
jgi:hypothetical protein